MKTLPLVVLTLFLAACQSPMEIQTVHVFTTLQLEKNCTQEWIRPLLSSGVPPGGYVCQRPTSLIIMHLQVTCLDSTQTWSDDGWTFLWDQELANQLDVPAHDGDGLLYTLNAGGGLSPANNDAVQTTVEDDKLVFRYASAAHGAMVETAKVTAIDDEAVTVGIESESAVGCLSGTLW